MVVSLRGYRFRIGATTLSRNSSTCSGARPTKRAGSSAAARSTLANAGSAVQPLEQVVRPALLFDYGGGGLAVAADALVQILPVAAGGDGGHQDVLGGHERQLFGQMLGDHLRIDDQPDGDVLIQQQDRVDGQERLRQHQPAVGAVVERALQPLRGGGRRRRSIAG